MLELFGARVEIFGALEAEHWMVGGVTGCEVDDGGGLEVPSFAVGEDQAGGGGGFGLRG